MESGFTDVTRLAEACERLRDLIEPTGKTECAIAEATGRTLSSDVTADRAVPHYERAAMDGFAVRAADTQQSGRGPIELSVGSDASAGRAVRVHTGSALPAGADAVVKIEDVTRRGEDIEVESAVTAGHNVSPVGEDVEEGQHLFAAGHRLRPADLGLLRATGLERVTVSEVPRVSVIPTGEELVTADPDPGEVVETNGLVTARLAERWGAQTTYRDVVTDDSDALAGAIERDADHDLVVTTGGTSVGERDLLPDVVADRGELVEHGIAIKPGHPVGFGTVDGTPILLLPGYPVSCLVCATQLLRPAIAAAAGFEPDPMPSTRATLTRKIHSEPGTRTFSRVTETAEGVEPLRTGGAGVLSSVTMCDGWVVTPESREGYEAGEEVAVEHWAWQP